MHLFSAVFLFLSLQGNYGLQLIFYDDGAVCILDYTNPLSIERTDNVTSYKGNSKCYDVGYFGEIGLDYDMSKELLYYLDDHDYDHIFLKGLPFNLSLEAISTKYDMEQEKISRYVRLEYPYRYDNLHINWVDNTFYTSSKHLGVRSGSVLRSDEIVPTHVVISRKAVAQLINVVDINDIAIEKVQMDPYEQFLFVLVKIYEPISGDVAPFPRNSHYVVLRSKLNGTDLTVIVRTPLNLEYVTFCIDVGEMMLYVSRAKNLFKYNYEGVLLEEFSLPVFAKRIAVLGSSLHLTSRFSDNVREISLSRKKGPLDTTHFYLHDNNISNMNFKLLDARVQRRKKDGQYVCNRNDCPELCEVQPSGDKCICYKNKAKTRDGISCYRCGLSNLTGVVLQTVIVNGNRSQIRDFPWHATLYETDTLKHFCGGTLISSRVVLTAAHCVTYDSTKFIPPLKNVNEMFVAFGKIKRTWTYNEEFQTTRQVTTITTHEQYRGSSRSYAHDIALLFLNAEVDTSNFVMPACLDYNLNQLPPHETLTGYVPGFGYTEECGAMCSNKSENLMHSEVQVSAYAKCFTDSNRIQPTVFHGLTPDKFCIGKGSVSAVQEGDSGGGLTLEYKGLHYLTGVVSIKLVNKYKTQYSFGAFTNVSFHMDWLKRNILEDDLSH